MKFWRRAILHVDMDAFYASVEQQDNPELKGKPVLVGGSPETRGVISAASYEARRFGVHSAMPTSKALRLCPHAILLPVRMERYKEVSDSVFAVFDKVTPLVQAISLDEAFLDVTGCQRLHGDPVAIARRIRLSINKATGLTASVGVASCRFVAKIASDLNKPDSLTVIPEEEMLARLAPLPVTKIWGVGAVTAKKLQRMGIASIGQLREWPESVLADEFGKAGSELYRLAHGIDDSEVISEEEDKSISHETTFPKDTLDIEELEVTLLEQADKVASRMRRRGLFGKTVFLKLRYSDFSLITRRKSLATPTCLAAVIRDEAARLMHEKTEAGSRPVRLLGVGMAGLSVGKQAQAGLFAVQDENSEKEERIERTADAIRTKLGKNAIQRASLKFRK